MANFFPSMELSVLIRSWSTHAFPFAVRTHRRSTVIRKLLINRIRADTREFPISSLMIFGIDIFSCISVLSIIYLTMLIFLRILTIAESRPSFNQNLKIDVN